jgi:hypothetical protein
VVRRAGPQVVHNLPPVDLACDVVALLHRAARQHHALVEPADVGRALLSIRSLPATSAPVAMLGRIAATSLATTDSARATLTPAASRGDA